MVRNASREKWGKGGGGMKSEQSISFKKSRRGKDNDAMGQLRRGLDRYEDCLM